MPVNPNGDINVEKYSDRTEIWRGDHILGEYGPENDRYSWGAHDPTGKFAGGECESEIQAVIHIFETDLDGAK